MLFSSAHNQPRNSHSKACSYSLFLCNQRSRRPDRASNMHVVTCQGLGNSSRRIKSSSWRGVACVAVISSLLLWVVYKYNGDAFTSEAIRAASGFARPPDTSFAQQAPEQPSVDLLLHSYLSIPRAKQLAEWSRDLTPPPEPALRGEPRPGCKYVQWFTALGSRYAIKQQSDLYRQMLRAALVSKIFNAPSLKANIIYDGEPDSFTAWWESQGGRVWYHNLTFYDQLKSAYASDGRIEKQWLTQYGAYLRMDLPHLLKGVEVAEGVEDNYILYTDVDVLFLQDIDSCTIQPPRHVRMGAELNRGEIINSGIMYINMSSFSANISNLVKWGVDHKFPGILDQTVLLEFYKQDLDPLPDIFNWKGYWGSDPNATILHFHGPKPGRCLDCFSMYRNDNLTDICVGRGGRCASYIPIFQLATDKGAFYERILFLFYAYVAKAYLP